MKQPRSAATIIAIILLIITISNIIIITIGIIVIIVPTLNRYDTGCIPQLCYDGGNIPVLLPGLSAQRVSRSKASPF